MNKEIKTIDEVEIEVLKAAENMNKTTAKIFLWVFAVVIVVIIGTIWLANNSNNLEVSENLSGYIFLALMGITIIIFVFSLIQKVTKKKVANRTYITIPYNNKTVEEIDSIIKNALSQLYYKEKKYGDEIVYYAYKSAIYNNGLNISSLPRYIKYRVGSDNIEVEGWLVQGAKEFPIDSKSYGLYNKQALVTDLKSISASVNYVERS